MSAILKRSISIDGHRTSYSLEQPFYDELAGIAAARQTSVAALVIEIDRNRAQGSNLSSAIRLFVLGALKQETGPPIG